MKYGYLKWVALFLSSGTLICCALPILLVSLGFGSFVAAAFFNIPALTFMAEHKYWTLAISFGFLLFLAWIVYRPNQSCPAEADLAKACKSSKSYNKAIFIVSVVIWFTGFFFSVLLLPLRNLLGV